MAKPERVDLRHGRRLPELRRVGDWGSPLKTSDGAASIVRLSEARSLDLWPLVWAGSRHDHRFFELVDETIPPFDYHYLILDDRTGTPRAIQPVFVCSQNVLDGTTGRTRRFVERLNRVAPKLGVLRTLMVGSPVGEGGFGARPEDRAWCAGVLGDVLSQVARRLGASVAVFKEFPSTHRPVLDVLGDRGYARIASMPYVSLDITFQSFDEYLRRSLGASTRKDLRRKFKEAERFPPLSMEVVQDVSDRAEALHALYLHVYERAAMRFERLSVEYFRRLGRDMPDRARFFVWSQAGRPVAVNVCMLHDDVLWADYLGLDYRVALELHLYFIVMRDVIDWCCRNHVRRYCGSSLNYEPKWRLGCRLEPMDLYLRHVNPVANRVLKRLAPWLSPVRYDPLLERFPNADSL